MFPHTLHDQVSLTPCVTEADDYLTQIFIDPQSETEITYPRDIPLAAHELDVIRGRIPANALDVQVGGGHYKGKRIQPVEYSHANGLNFLEGCIVKRITRWRDKPVQQRFQDLEKIKHEVDLLIELETRYPA